MNSQIIFFLLIRLLLYALPYIIIWLIGITIATVNWRRHPRLSLLVTITLVLFILQNIIGMALGSALPLIQINSGMSLSTIAVYENLLALANIVTTIPLWALLIWAIFGWRKTASPVTPLPQTPQQWPPHQPQAQPLQLSPQPSQQPQPQSLQPGFSPPQNPPSPSGPTPPQDTP